MALAGRGPNGRSTIFLGIDKRWHGWVSMGTTKTGRRNRRHVSGKTRAIVVAKVQALEDQRETTRSYDAGPTTVGDWLEYWLSNIASNRVRPRTLEGYRAVVRLHIAPILGHIPLVALEPEHLETTYATLLERGLSPSTVLRIHRIVSRSLKVAVQRQRITRNVAQLVDGPSQRPQHVARPLTLDEARSVLAAARRGRNPVRWSVALALGLRQSEALALQWTDLDLDEARLTVRRTLHRVTGKGLVYEKPKTERSRRTIAIPSQLVADLRVHKTTQASEKSAAGPDWHDDDLVFAQRDGRPIDKGSDYDSWCRLLEAAGVGHVRLHDARHTAATLLLAKGVHPRVVMELLGHSQMRTTTDIYSHVMPAMARAAADQMDSTLFADPTAEPPFNSAGASGREPQDAT